MAERAGVLVQDQAEAMRLVLHFTIDALMQSSRADFVHATHGRKLGMPELAPEEAKRLDVAAAAVLRHLHAMRPLPAQAECDGHCACHNDVQFTRCLDGCGCKPPPDDKETG